jgi:hypothetical protein
MIQQQGIGRILCPLSERLVFALNKFIHQVTRLFRQFATTIPALRRLREQAKITRAIGSLRGAVTGDPGPQGPFRHALIGRQWLTA